MNKEEILEKSRNKFQDEGKEKMLEFGLKYYELAIILLGILFVGLNYILKQPPLFDVSIAVWAFLAASNYPKWRFTKEKKYLLKMIAEGAMTILYLCLHIHFLLNL